MKLILKNMLKGNVKIYEIIFQICMISFPFGANILSIYTGFFTIYPYLLILTGLFIYSFFFKQTTTPKYYKVVVAYFFALLAYAVLRASISGFNSYAVFDIKNLLLLFITIYVLFQSDIILGWFKIKKILGNIFVLFFILFTLIAVFEYLTGIHIWGQFSEKLLTLPISGVTYTPVFVYDNPNNFITYYILIGILAIMLNDDIQHNLWISLIIIGLMVCFSLVADSRFGKITSVFLFISIFLIQFNKIKTYFFDRKFSFVLIIVFILISFLFKPLYFGPYWQKNDRSFENEIVLVQTQPSIKVFNIYQLEDSSMKQEVVVAYKKFKDDQQLKGSNAVRFKLIKNGWYLFKTSHGLGVGPGMYRYLHDTKKVPENVEAQNGPHNWIIELLSQFGFFCFLYILFLLFMIWISIRSYKNHKSSSLFFIVSILAFLIMSNAPSAFGLLDINWVFTGIMILFFRNEIINTPEIENRTA
jgi:hypothetical protein